MHHRRCRWRDCSHCVTGMSTCRMLAVTELCLAVHFRSRSSMHDCRQHTDVSRTLTITHMFRNQACLYFRRPRSHCAIFSASAGSSSFSSGIRVTFVPSSHALGFVLSLHSQMLEVNGMWHKCCEVGLLMSCMIEYRLTCMLHKAVLA